MHEWLEITSREQGHEVSMNEEVCYTLTLLLSLLRLFMQLYLFVDLYCYIEEIFVIQMVFPASPSNRNYVTALSIYPLTSPRLMSIEFLDFERKYVLFLQILFF